MLSCSFKCKKKIENINPKVEKTKNGRILLSSNYAVCGSKKSRFIKEQEASGFSTGLLWAKLPFEGILVFGNII